VDIPGYKKKDGYNVLVFNRMFVSQKFLDKGIVKIPKSDIQIRIKKSKMKDFTQLRISLQNEDVVFEFVYDKKTEIEQTSMADRYFSIDMGVDNLAAVASNCSPSFIVNGKPVKQINHKYDKRKARLQEKLAIKEQLYNLEGLDKSLELSDEEYKKLQKKHSGKVRCTSHQIKKLEQKRKYRIDDYFHKATRYIINQAVENHIGTIFIGHNNGWKQDINIGKRNNQNFVQIPFSKFINMMRYKAELCGIKVIITEESYTSKASFLDGDFIPVYDENRHTDYQFSGRRIKRGLYKSSDGRLINADLNGAFNIMRKQLNVTVDALMPAVRGFVFNPRKIAFLDTKKTVKIS